MGCETETKDYKYMKDNQTIFVGLKFRKKDVFDLSANLLGHGRNYWNQRNEMNL